MIKRHSRAGITGLGGTGDHYLDKWKQFAKRRVPDLGKEDEAHSLLPLLERATRKAGKSNCRSSLTTLKSKVEQGD